MYYKRMIDKSLQEWASKETHKPVLLRGARQVGKSTAVRHLGECFESYVEINFEKQAEYKELFEGNLDVHRIVSQMAAMCGKPIQPGKTLLFLDEVQACPNAIMALRFFKEDMSQLHVVAAGSLLEFSLAELPTFGVGRIHSMFMYPMTFDEFLEANGERLLMDARDQATPALPLSTPLHNKLVDLVRAYLLVGGMPEVVAKWATTHDFLQCQEIQDDIVVSYEDDFPKYKKRVDPMLLRLVMRSAAVQASQKFVYTQTGGGYKTNEIKKAIELLVMAGLLVPVTHTAANGLPLGGESDAAYRKLLLLDTGLLLRLLNMDLGNANEITTHVLTASAVDLVNKGPMAEHMTGLELLRYQSPHMRHELYYWQRQAKNSVAEIDFVTNYGQQVLPIEVKAGTQGGMKSLWMFMREKKLEIAARCSLENFGVFDYIDNMAEGVVRHVCICPIYALSRLNGLLSTLNVN